LETIDFSTATKVSVLALENVGVPAQQARTQVELLVEAELRGRASHGLQRLPRIIARIQNGVADPGAKGTGEWRGDALLNVDGNRGLGPVVAFDALAKISVRAKSTGIAAAVIRNCNHIGMLALYAERMAEQGQILIALTTSEALVHPWGGRSAMMGTNPIAIGVPAKPFPFVLDMATSVVSMGQIHDYANRGEPLVPGWALDQNGDPTTDAAAARAGAIAPFGQAKGYALGLAFEVLVASLTASALGREVGGTLDETNVCNKGDVFIVVEPASSDVAMSISAYLDAIRACEPTDSSRPVIVPGDRSQTVRERALRTGVSLPVTVWQTISTLAKAVH
jgi:L-2-hydroxycarboxylate dehydrogenase (NAD+)